MSSTSRFILLRSSTSIVFDEPRKSVTVKEMFMRYRLWMPDKRGTNELTVDSSNTADHSNCITIS